MEGAEVVRASVDLDVEVLLVELRDLVLVPVGARETSGQRAATDGGRHALAGLRGGEAPGRARTHGQLGPRGGGGRAGPAGGVSGGHRHLLDQQGGAVAEQLRIGVLAAPDHPADDQPHRQERAQPPAHLRHRVGAAVVAPAVAHEQAIVVVILERHGVNFLRAVSPRPGRAGGRAAVKAAKV
jgi:hypothetical protein